MTSWAEIGRRWLRTLRRDEQPAAPAAKSLEIRTGASAALHVEAQVADRIFRGLVAGETRSLGEYEVGTNAFGAPVAAALGDDAADALAVAIGSALGGERAAVLLDHESLAPAHAALRSAAARRVPLVIHAVTAMDLGASASPGGDGHGPYHALTDSGALLAFAGSAQDVVDKALIARRLAERTLGVAVVAMDGPETAWAPSSLQLPDAKLIRAFLGAAGDDIAAPTAEQRFLFGERRRRVPRWFDPDRPAALGVQQSGPDLAAALGGRRLLSAASQLQALHDCLNEYAAQTGRRVETLSRYRVDGADYVFVAQGVAVAALRALVDRLRDERGERVGVIGIEWLRPFDGQALASLLDGRRGVCIVERCIDLGGPGPLWREVRGVWSARDVPVYHASCGIGGTPISNADLLSLFERMKAEVREGSSVLLGVSAPREDRDHPQHQALVQRLRSEFPGIEREALVNGAALDLRPASSRSVALWARDTDASELDVEEAARELARVVGPWVKGRVHQAEQGTWVAQITASPEAFQDPVGITAHDVAVVATSELPGAIDPLRSMAHGGRVLLSSALGATELWRELPATWRRAIREKQLRVQVADATLSELMACLPSLLGAAEVSPIALETLDVDLLDAGPDAEELSPPLAVRRFDQTRRRFDNLPRFWTEHALPRREGSAAPAELDPYVSVAALPPSTAALFEVAVHRGRLPLVDAERCTACGACWTACPDAAIAPAVIGTEALLNAAADQATPPGETRSAAADKLRRVHRQLAGRIDGQLAKVGARQLTEPLLRDALMWLQEQMKLPAEERVEFEAAFERTLAVIGRLPFAATELLFHRAHATKKGSGELLGLSVNPAACQGCGGCSAVCGENAISVAQRTPAAVQAAAAGWATWEGLPDPSGASIDHVASRAEVGRMAAVMTSRHTLLSVTGGGGHEPGSGARIAARLVIAATEYEMQRRVVQRVKGLEELAAGLAAALQQTVTKALPVSDLAPLERALQDVPDHGNNLGALVAGLERAGARAELDGDAARLWVDLCRGIQHEIEALTRGEDGLGRARFGLVVTGTPLAEWAAEYPRNPFAVPVVVELSERAPDIARGLAENLLRRHAASVASVRHAERALAEPAQARLRPATAISELSAVERAACPPVVVLAGPDAFSAPAATGLHRLLRGRLPVKVVVLDGRERWLGSPDPLLPLIAQRRAFIAASTIAHREHLFDAMTRALRHPGPALLHVYAPSPARHGFDGADTIARARAAVECRLHPLLIWDPSSPGVFGRRLELDGNPSPAAAWSTDAEGAALTPAHFALGERRFAPHFVSRDGTPVTADEWLLSDPERRHASAPFLRSGDVECVLDEALADGCLERLENWQTLQELAGVVTPFTERVATQIERRVVAEHEAALAALRREYEAQFAAQQQATLADATARLRTRLVQLAGYQRPPPKDGPS